MDLDKITRCGTERWHRGHPVPLAWPRAERPDLSRDRLEAAPAPERPRETGGKGSLQLQILAEYFAKICNLVGARTCAAPQHF
jgi:hypothetical protein